LLDPQNTKSQCIWNNRGWIKIFVWKRNDIQKLAKHIIMIFGLPSEPMLGCIIT